MPDVLAAPGHTIDCEFCGRWLIRFKGEAKFDVNRKASAVMPSMDSIVMTAIRENRHLVTVVPTGGICLRRKCLNLYEKKYNYRPRKLRTAAALESRILIGFAAGATVMSIVNAVFWRFNLLSFWLIGFDSGLIAIIVLKWVFGREKSHDNNRTRK